MSCYPFCPQDTFYCFNVLLPFLSARYILLFQCFANVSVRKIHFIVSIFCYRFCPRDTFYCFNVLLPFLSQDTFCYFSVLLTFLSTTYTLLNIHKCDNSLRNVRVYCNEVCGHVCSMHVLYSGGFGCKQGSELATNLKVYMFFLSTFCHLPRYVITLANVRCLLIQVLILAVDSVLFGLLRIQFYCSP
jgi:hypothetical protein